jgi:DNA-binding transcriptional MerR regulator
MDPSWTLAELVAEVAARISALPAPKNGQVRAVPDDRTIRYYAAIGLLDRPGAMRGRTALYGPRHAAQVVAIKRLQTMGRSLSEIRELWPTLDDRTLARMSGVDLGMVPKPIARGAFWKADAAPPAAGYGAEPEARNGTRPAIADTAAAAADPEAVHGVRGATADAAVAGPSAPGAQAPAALELRIELAPRVVLSLAVVDDSVALSAADVRAIRAAAAPLVAELASRRLAPHLGGDEP